MLKTVCVNTISETACLAVKANLASGILTLIAFVIIIAIIIAHTNASK